MLTTGIDAAIFPVTNCKMAFTTDSFVVKGEVAEEILGKIHRLEQCRDARIIGTFIQESRGVVYMENILEGKEF